MDSICYGDFSDHGLWPDEALVYQIECEKRWRTAQTAEVVACAERELQRRKEGHGKEIV